MTFSSYVTMYDASRFLILNNYGYSNEQIEFIKEYSTNRKFPPHVADNAKTKRLIEIWTNFETVKENLIYIPLDLEVVPDNKRGETSLNFTKIYVKVLPEESTCLSSHSILRK